MTSTNVVSARPGEERTAPPLKCGTCFAALDAHGFVTDAARPVAGVFLHDTRHLSLWRWHLPDFELLEQTSGPGALVQHWSRLVDHARDVRVRRELRLEPDGVLDTLVVASEAPEPTALTVRLDAEADFRDLLELRGLGRCAGRNAPSTRREGDVRVTRYVARDGIESSTRVAVHGVPGDATIRLEPGRTHRVEARATFSSTLAAPIGEATLAWSESALAARADASDGLAQAFDDIDALASPSDHGPLVTTGIPNFATVFGRDALITARFLMTAAPALVVSTLRTLAEHRGRVRDPFNEEAPGRIVHELRVGELARTREVPFERYYGAHDTNALFLWLLADQVDAAGDAALARELEPAWREALAWIEDARDDDGLLRYRHARHGRGLVNTSWKDSDDSLSYADGSLPSGPLAVVEIQGYLVAAFEAASRLQLACGGDAREADRWLAEARSMRRRIDAAFWNEALGLHAVAIDAAGRQLDVATSNPGHLLWAGALEPARAERVAGRLFEEDLWSGWGLRTLSNRARRYQPLSYHNGSVWPHDTAVFAAGLLRYGLTGEAERVLEALNRLAASQPRRQLPELVGGCPRTGSTPPPSYAEACRPQAWAAAGLIHLSLAMPSSRESR